MFHVLEFIAVYPRTAMLLAITGLIMMALLSLSPRARTLAVFVVMLAPIAPLLLLRCCCHLIIVAIDHVTVDRPWTALRSTEYEL
jgi:hypothetical protein